MSKLTDLEVKFLFTTKMAIAITDGTLDDNGKPVVVFLPKSQVEYDHDPTPGDIITVTLPEWLAIDKELV